MYIFLINSNIHLQTLTSIATNQEQRLLKLEDSKKTSDSSVNNDKDNDWKPSLPEGGTSGISGKSGGGNNEGTLSSCLND